MKHLVERSGSYVMRAAVVGTLAFGVLAGSASAADAQTSTLNFTGSANLADAAGSGGSLLFIDFLSGAIVGPPTGTVAAVPAITGTFAGDVVVGQMGTIKDLTVGMGGVVGLPISNFLQFGSYTFTLTGTQAPGGSVNFGPLGLDERAGSTVGFFGVFGTVTGGGFGTSTRAFQGLFTTNFTGQTPTQVFDQINAGGTFASQSFSAEFVVAGPTVIPEPSTYLLFATGLVTLGGMARFRARKEEE